MNRPERVILFIVVAVSLMGCIDGQRRRYTDAILNVLQEMEEDCAQAQKELEEADQAEGEGVFAYADIHRRLLDRLSGIDTSRCPPEFQEAFEDHLRARNEAVHLVESVVGKGALFRNLITFGKSGFLPAMENGDKIAKDLSDTELKLKRIAMQYDITFED